MVPTVLDAAALLAWLATALRPGRLWDLRPIAEEQPVAAVPTAWPSVCVLVHARNESARLTSPAGHAGAGLSRPVADRARGRHDSYAALAQSASGTRDPESRAVTFRLNSLLSELADSLAGATTISTARFDVTPRRRAPGQTSSPMPIVASPAWAAGIAGLAWVGRD